MHLKQISSLPVRFFPVIFIFRISRRTFVNTYLQKHKYDINTEQSTYKNLILTAVSRLGFNVPLNTIQDILETIFSSDL